MVTFTNIPEELQARRQWVVWRLEERGGKRTKVPYQPSGEKAQSTGAETWSTFDEARAAYQRGGFSGIGFVVTADDPYIGVDLDHVIADGALVPWAAGIVRGLASYTEITPSGDGVRVWVKADCLAAIERHKRNMEDGRAIEIYGAGRYFTVTGMKLAGAPGEIRAADAALMGVYADYLAPAPVVAPVAARATGTVDRADDIDLIDLIRGSRSGGDFGRLYGGDCSGQGGDHSAADLALCSMLAFWTGGDRGQMDRLFRRSGLMREKWDRKTGATTYGAMTLDKAVRECREFYAPKSRPAPPEPEDEMPPEWGEDGPDWAGETAAVVGGERAGRMPAVHEASREPVRNNRVEWEDTEKGPKARSYALAPAAIYAQMDARTAGGLRAVEGTPFVADGARPRWIERPAALFAWMQAATAAPVSWDSQQGADGLSFVTKEEYYEYARRACPQYEAVEAYPHQPPLPHHFYLWEDDADYRPDGQYLDALVGLFDNVETLYDAYIIKAMFLTPAWGGAHGRRPMFSITAPTTSCGKSNLAAMVGRLYGGYIEGFQGSKRGSEDLITRLLTPSARFLRVVRLDNIKGELSDGTLEGLITGDVISGRQLNQGEGRRPNTLTWIITGNGLEMAQDFAQRSMPIRLTQPTTFRSEWEQSVREFIDHHRRQILMDCIWTLQQPALSDDHNDRWSEWVAGVLSRVTSGIAPLLDTVKGRRAENNSDQEQADMIYEELCRLPESARTDKGRGWWFVPNRVLRTVVEDATGERGRSEKAVGGMMRRHESSSRFGGKVQYQKDRKGNRGYMFWIDTDEG